MPHFFVVPGPTVIKELVANAPAVIRPFGQISHAGFVAGIAVVVMRKEISELVKSQFLRVSQAICKNLHIRTVKFATNHTASIWQVQVLAFRCFYINTTIADTEIQSAVGTDLQTMKVVAQKSDMDPTPVEQGLPDIRLAIAVGVLQEPEFWQAGEINIALTCQNAGPQPIFRLLEAFGENA